MPLYWTRIISNFFLNLVLIPIGYSLSLLTSKKLLVLIDGHHYQKQHTDQMHRSTEFGMSSLSGYDYNLLLESKTQNISIEESNDCKSQRTMCYEIIFSRDDKKAKVHGSLMI